VIEEFKSLDVDPSERVERYRSLFETYYKEALAHRERGDTRQAGEKMWGAMTPPRPGRARLSVVRVS